MDETTRNEHTLKAVGSVEGLGLGRPGGDSGEEVIQMLKVWKFFVYKLPQRYSFRTGTMA